MSNGTTRTIAVRLQFNRIDRTGEGWMNVACLGCGATLEIHQPDQEHPDRLLGTCDACHGWVVADFARDRDDGAIVFIPDGEFLLNLDGGAS